MLSDFDIRIIEIERRIRRIEQELTILKVQALQAENAVRILSSNE